MVWTGHYNSWITTERVVSGPFKFPNRRAGRDSSSVISCQPTPQGKVFSQLFRCRIFMHGGYPSSQEEIHFERGSKQDGSRVSVAHQLDFVSSIELFFVSALTPKRRAKGKFHYPTARLFSASLKMKIKIFFLLEIVRNYVKKHKMQLFPFRFHLAWTGSHLKIGNA